MPFQPVPTPCVGICSTTYGDTVCRGCRRYLHEVIDWNRYQDSEKRAVWARLDALMTQILPNHIQIDDAALLRQQLTAYRVPHRPEANDWACVYALLKVGAKHLQDIQPFGLRRVGPIAHEPLVTVKEAIQVELHDLASAYYERDVLRAQKHAGAPERT